MQPARRRSGRWALLALLPAVVGGAVALGGAALTGNLGGEGRTTTIVRQVGPVPAALQETRVPVPVPEAPSESPAESPTEDGGPLSVQEIVRDSSPAIVLVAAGTGGSRTFGTGFVIDRAGHIITNEHVVDDEKTVTITFQDKGESEAEVLGTDPSTDLAVLELKEPRPGLRPLPLGRSGLLEVGDAVVAIGNPFGLERTATTGIVSALQRSIDAPDGFPIQNAIQTDAAINHGNSGGPLLDRLGRVIGINSQIFSETGGNDGIGFAVPIDTVRPVARAILATGRVEHAWVGVVGRDVTPEIARALGIPGRRGVAILSVDERGPAAKAGVTPATTGEDAEVPRGGDIVIAINGQPVAGMADVSQEVASRAVGARIRVTLMRDKVARTITLTLADRPSDIRPVR